MGRLGPEMTAQSSGESESNRGFWHCRHSCIQVIAHTYTHDTHDKSILNGMRVHTLMNSPHDGAVVWHWRHRYVQVERCACAPVGPVASDTQVLCADRVLMLVGEGGGGPKLIGHVGAIVIKFLCVRSNQARG